MGKGIRRTPEQIIRKLRQAEVLSGQGKTVEQICRELGVSDATYYKWRKEYGKPPSATQFKKGQSGNPKGRPKNRHRSIPYDAVLGQIVTIREDGRERRVTAAQAFLLQLTQKGLAGDSAAARDALDAIENARINRGDHVQNIDTIILTSIDTGADSILEPLRLAKKKYPTDKNRVRWALKPWIVEAALKRLGEKQLSTEEQQEVWNATLTPSKVAWPNWWEVKGE